MVILNNKVTCRIRLRSNVRKPDCVDDYWHLFNYKINGERLKRLLKINQTILILLQVWMSCKYSED